MILLNFILNLHPQIQIAMISKEENIMLSAEKLFAEKGFSATSTREISAAANVNISMISYYFGSKEKLFEKIFEYRMHQGLDFASGVMEKDINAWEKLILILDRYVERVKTLRDFYLILQREQINYSNPATIIFIKNSKKNFIEIYGKLIEEGWNSGIFKRKPEMEFLHSTISGTLFTAMNTLPVYKEFFEGDAGYENRYYDKLNLHIKKIMKYLLGYEENV